MKFKGTETYVATEDLMMAVNAAVTLERPLLIKGEPGTGKTMLAIEVAKALERPLYQWHVKSTSKAQQGLYETTRCRGCAIPSWATLAYTISPITSSGDRCGMPSSPTAPRCC